MSIPISGTLYDPYGHVARFADIKFVTLQGSGDVIETSNATFRTDENGTYAMDVQFGRFAVYMRFNGNNGSYNKIQAVTVNSDTTATTLGELLAYTEPLTPDEILIVQALVNEAIAAKDDAQAAALQAAIDESSAAASAAVAQASATAAANSSALLAPVPLNGGVWASGQQFTAYNQYMIYSGEAYSPLPATTLPYTVGATPDLGFVYQISLNDHSKLANRNAVGAHDAIYRRKTTLPEVLLGSLSDGLQVEIIDTHAKNFTITSADPSPLFSIPSGSNYAVLEKTSAVDILDLGVSSGDDIFQVLTDYQSGYDRIIFNNGTYDIGSDITLDIDLSFNGGIIRPLSGVTVTLKRSYFSMYPRQCFDCSLGGSIAVTDDTMVSEFETVHFGGKSNDVSYASENMFAVKKCLEAAGSLGVPDGIYLAPIARLSRGRYFVTDDDGDGIGAVVRSYTTFKGFGDTSVLAVIPNAPLFSVLVVNDDGANSVIIDDMLLDGDYANQTNAINGILFNCPLSRAIYCVVGSGMYIKEFRGHNIKVIGKGLDDSSIEPKLCRDAYLGNLYVEAARDLTINGSYRSSKNSNPSIELSGPLVFDVEINASCKDNTGYGIRAINISGELTITDKASFARNFKSDIYIENCPRPRIAAARLSLSREAAIYMKNCSDGFDIARPYIYGCRRQGVVLENSNWGSVDANINASSDTNNNVYDAILLLGSSSYNTIGGKIKAGATYKHRYALAIDSSTCVSNRYFNTDFQSGATGTISDTGTTTSVLANLSRP